MSESFQERFKSRCGEGSGSVVVYLSGDGSVAGSSLPGVTGLCPFRARHINPCLVLV